MWIEGTIVKRKDWNNKLFSLLIQADIAPFEPGQFIKVALPLEDKRIGRAYSLVNQPGSDMLEILVVAVENGKLSPALANLQVGDRLQVSAKASGFMTLDGIPPCRDLWLLATGTAVGPFISMLRCEQIWEQFENIVLVYGVRYAEDLAYIDELNEIALLHPQFRLCLSVTRESIDAAYSKRITSLLSEGILENDLALAINPANSHLILCGNPQMVSETQQLLQQRGLAMHLKRHAGQISVEKYW
ncbi:ferredoxin--NADP reductase [Bowmanella pacifica]|uniref:ferredoxin--NADP(+) reductase n=1 Tax=Bowmanella pacifica TaxID=502051 RepID=A0A917Z4D9_9ALTE|nr:ferredoxin--NADP reductase [Bowmanella pacifica]GGO74910.1 ferredoxin--NADP(+) reductase [Bowmanella pacifica]